MQAPLCFPRWLFCVCRSSGSPPSRLHGCRKRTPVGPPTAARCHRTARVSAALCPHSVLGPSSSPSGLLQAHSLSTTGCLLPPRSLLWFLLARTLLAQLLCAWLDFSPLTSCSSFGRLPPFCRHPVQGHETALASSCPLCANMGLLLCVYDLFYRNWVIPLLYKGASP